jgi:hypothetical protein
MELFIALLFQKMFNFFFLFFFLKKKQILPSNLHFRYCTVEDEKLEEKMDINKLSEKSKDLFTKFKENKWLKKDSTLSIKQFSIVKPISKFRTFSSSRLSQSFINSSVDDI